MTHSTRNMLLAMGIALAMGCGSDPAPPPTLQVDIFGWTQADGFVSGMPDLEDAQTVRVKVTQPLDREVITQDTFPSGAGEGTIPEVAFGKNLRMEFEVLDGQGEVIGNGATPRFDFEPDQQLRTYRLQVGASEDYMPVGSVVVDRDSGERKFSWSRFDYRGKETNWLGRLGHATAKTSDGRILVVGGGDPVPGSSPGELPEFREVYDDIQIFDPETGYFTDLAFDESAGALLAEGEDRLFEPVVHHTVTPVGDDRFLVVGGFTPRQDVMRPVNTIQVIDLNAPAGTRVQRLVDEDGSALVLQKARGWHTATYRSIDDHVIVTGGVGPQGDDDVLDTFEMIDLASSAVYQQTFPMQAARAQHDAILMADARTIWLLGGRDDASALTSSEVIRLSDGGTTESAPEANMRTARFGLGAVRVTPGGGELVLVAGGYSDLDGTATDTFEISKLGRGSFESGTDWKMSKARGGVTAVELPQTNDIVVVGGRNSNGDTHATSDRLVFGDLTDSPPYAAEESKATQTLRYTPSVDLLSTGRILLIGGEGRVDGSAAALDSADVFNPHDPVGGSTDVVVIETNEEQ